MKYTLMLCMTALFCAACTQPKQLAYFVDAPRDTVQQIDEQPQCRVHKGDRLYIYVGAADAESVVPFNQETNRLLAGVNMKEAAAINSQLSRRALVDGAEGVTAQDDAVAVDLNAANAVRFASETAMPTGYAVDDEGYIAFPVIGRLHVEGLTLDSLCGLVRRSLLGHVKEPVVTARLLNFRVAVLGEVMQPHWLQVSGTRLTLLEALAMAGDMTVYGVRESVKVFREVDGQLTVGEVDMTSKELFDSPYYYLQQNDVVFVEPDKKRRKQYDYNDQLLPYIHLGVSIGSLTTNTGRTIIEIIRRR